MFGYLVGLIDLGIWVREIHFCLFVFVLDFRIEMVQGCYVINFTHFTLLDTAYELFFYTFFIWVILHFFLFVYRTSSRCFFTYILFEFSSTIYTQGYNIIFSLLQLLFMPVVYEIPSSLFSHNCFSYSNTVTLIA